MFSILFDHEETFFLLCNKKMRVLISFLFLPALRLRNPQQYILAEQL